MEVDVEEALKRDEIRYTKEKKDQLVALLGQSSGSDSSKESQLTATSLSYSTTDTERYDESNATAESGSNQPPPPSSTRHHANSLCSCSKCGTRYPFRPARGQSLISVSGGDRPLLKNASYGGQTIDHDSPPNVQRRQSMPDPFAELSDSPPGSVSRGGEPPARLVAEAKEKRKPGRSASKVTFLLGETD